MENLSEALLLLLVGMVTVFCVLLIVIFMGKCIVLFVNKYIPEVVKEKQAPVSNNNPTPSQVSAINQAIAMITNGKGYVINIEKK